MTTLRQEIDRWEAELTNIAETSQTDNWFLEERRLAEAQHTLVAFRGHILPMFSGGPDTVVALRALANVALRLERSAVR